MPENPPFQPDRVPHAQAGNRSHSPGRPPGTRGDGPFPGRLAAAAAMIFTAGAGIVLLVTTGTMPRMTPESRFLAGLIPLHVIGLGAGLLVRIHFAGPERLPAALDLTTPEPRFTPRDGAAYAAALYIICTLLSALSTMLLRAVGLQLAPPPIQQLLQQHPTPGFLLLISSAAVLFVPVAEEVAFRVILYDALESIVPPLSAAVTTAAVFSVLHGAPVQFPALFLLGFALQTFRWRYRSILPCILIHAFFNAWGMIFLWLSMKGMTS